MFVSLAMQHDIVLDSHWEERRRRQGDRQSEVDVSEGPTYFSWSRDGRLLEGKSGGKEAIAIFRCLVFVLLLIRDCRSH